MQFKTLAITALFVVVTFFGLIQAAQKNSPNGEEAKKDELKEQIREKTEQYLKKPFEKIGKAQNLEDLKKVALQETVHLNTWVVEMAHEFVREELKLIHDVKAKKKRKIEFETEIRNLDKDIEKRLEDLKKMFKEEFTNAKELGKYKDVIRNHLRKVLNDFLSKFMGDYDGVETLEILEFRIKHLNALNSKLYDSSDLNASSGAHYRWVIIIGGFLLLAFAVACAIYHYLIKK